MDLTREKETTRHGDHRAGGCKKGWLLLGLGGPSLGHRLGLRGALLEFVHAARGVHKGLLAGVERCEKLLMPME